MASADALGPLLELPGVRAAADEARAAVDQVHRHPANQRSWGATAAEASMRAARASATLDGGAAGGGAVADPVLADPVLAGAVRIAEAIGQLLGTWQRAPLQALARLHVLAAADLVGDDTSLGRPVPDRGVSARLHLLAETVAAGSAVPGVVLAAVVHGELLALSPFECCNGVVARAASRLTAISTGLDTKGLTVPEVGHLKRAAEYRSTAAGFATGDPAAVAAWLVHCCEAWQSGAREAHAIADAAT